MVIDLDRMLYMKKHIYSLHHKFSSKIGMWVRLFQKKEGELHHKTANLKVVKMQGMVSYIILKRESSSNRAIFRDHFFKEDKSMEYVWMRF